MYHISEICLQHILDVANKLALIETRGESTMLMYKIRLVLDATLKQMQEDNTDTEENHSHHEHQAETGEL